VGKLFALALGILTAIGGFVDIGDLVTNALVGSRFGLSLAWVVVVGIVGICGSDWVRGWGWLIWRRRWRSPS
jgi:manganese transport protein